MWALQTQAPCPGMGAAPHATDTGLQDQMEVLWGHMTGLGQPQPCGELGPGGERRTVAYGHLGSPRELCGWPDLGSSGHG